MFRLIFFKKKKIFSYREYVILRIFSSTIMLRQEKNRSVAIGRDVCGCEVYLKLFKNVELYFIYGYLNF